MPMRSEAHSLPAQEASTTPPTSSPYNRTADGANVTRRAAPSVRTRAWNGWRSMALLEMRNAAYVRSGVCVIGPIALSLEEGARLAYACNGADAAAAAALLAAGLLAPSRGTVFVGAFDPRIQPVQVKRI